MASMTVADHVLSRLREWDVDHVFGYAGDGINGLLAAWGRAEDGPEFVQARHEEMAAFEAVGYAKFNRRVGVCAAKAMLAGDEDRWGVLRQGVKTKLQEFLPHRGV